MTKQHSEIKDYIQKHYTGIKTFTKDLWRPYKTSLMPCFNSKGHCRSLPCRHSVHVSFFKNKDSTGKRVEESLKQKLLLDENPMLKLTHEEKEMAPELYRSKDMNSYLKLLPAFKEIICTNNLTEFQIAYSSIKNWHDENVYMFDYPYTNCLMERVNRSIKQSNNIAFGFTNLIRATKLIQYRIN